MNNKLNRRHGRASLASRLRGELVKPLAALLLLGSAAAALPPASTHAAVNDLTMMELKLELDGKAATVPGGLSAGGLSYVSLSVFGSKLGLAVGYDAKAREMSIAGRGRQMIMKAGSGEYQLDGHLVYGVSPVIVNGRTYLPLRFLLEHMGYDIGYAAASKLITVRTVAENDLQLAANTMEDSGAGWSVKVEYPKISAYADEAAADAVNKVLRERATALFEAGKQELKTAAGGMQTGSEARPLQFTVAFEETSNRSGKLSLFFTVVSDMGGAHPISFREAHTFDLRDGSELTLKEAAGGDPNYTAVINAAVAAQLKQRNIVLFEPFTSIKTDQGFFLRGDTLVVYFDADEIAAHAYGVLEFPIPSTDD